MFDKPARVRRAPRILAVILVVPMFLLTPSRGAAQQRPLQTHDAEPIGAGQVLVQVGFDYGGEVFPASGLEGSLLRVPVIGAIFGVSSIAQIELTGGPYQRLSISDRFPAPLAREVTATGESTHSVVDLSIGAHVRLMPETASRPSLAFRFSTRLPNSKHPSGLGLNTTDFHVGFAAAKTVGAVRLVGNVGLGILPDPVNGSSQNDVLTYGLSLSAPVEHQIELVGELNGRASVARGVPPAGTESRNVLLLGARYLRGATRLDAGLFFATTPRDPVIGVTGGVTWFFKAWTL